MVAIPRLRIKFGPEGSVKTFQKVPDTKIAGNAKLIEKSFGEDVTKAENQSRKRGPNELEEVQAANKKQKLDRFLSSQCFTLLKLLMEQKYGWFFNEPVDPVKLKIPDYFSVVSKPMDLGTVKSRLLKNAYSGADEFAADVRLTFDNAMLYNPPGHFVYNTAKKSKEIFEVRWGSLEKRKKLSKLSVSEVDCARQRSTETAASSGRFELPKPVKEKSEKVSLLLKPVKGESKKDTPVVTPKALATKLRVKKLEQGLGMSSTVKIPSKGSGLNGSCKCGSCGRITCVCLKSCNSSGSEVSSLTDCLVKNTSGSQATESDPQSNGSVSSRNEKNGCVSSQLDNELKTTLPAMPPLPPEKALRAAILKGQFAETILRAKHRKVLDQNNNKADLIRIQIEKEQMERAQREEKARIVAEMRAAEIARRMRAETELKQKRERQRLELEMMRKTFDFEENNFLILDKDLVKICGSSNLTRTMLLELGLLLRKDDCVEEMDSEIPDAMIIDDLEEGEIF